MTSQGLRASPDGIRFAKIALTDKTLSQQKLADALGITRQPVSKFFAGESVSRSCFVQICQQLGLSWQNVVYLPEEVTSEVKLPSSGVDIDVLVGEVRQKRQDKIQNQCGTLQMLDIAQSVPLVEIYTPVNVLTEIRSQQWREISDLWKDLHVESNFYGFGEIQHPRILSGLESLSQYSKLMVLGKPGSGKSTFSQYLAMQCNEGKLLSNHAPIFIRLKEFTEDTQHELNISKYIVQEFSCSGIDEQSTVELLNEGKALILLDGVDEIPLSQSEQVMREIRQFTQKYYKNQFVITCRIAAHKYRFPGFNEVEIADFEDQQIELFVKKWFVVVAHQSSHEAVIAGNSFIQQLNLPSNHGIRELSTTPILLHLLCLVFKPKMQFPHKPANLYEQALNILLAKWDEVRGIQRDSFYANLPLSHKKKLLSYLAMNTFVKGEYLFEQDRIQQLVSEYLSNLPDISKQADTLRLDSEGVLREIKAQDGLLVEKAREIHAFSHLVFQEYLTAKSIVQIPQDNAWHLLTNHLTEERWYKLFLLTISMLPNPDEMLQLMKHKIDEMVAGNEKIQSYLIWLYQKTSTVANSKKSSTIRAFYIICNYAFTGISSCILPWNFGSNLDFNSEFTLDQLLFGTLTCGTELESAFEHNLHDVHVFNHSHALHINFDKVMEIVGESKFKEELQKLKKKLPSTDHNLVKLRHWWQDNGKIWNQQLKNNLIKYRNIGYDWKFSPQEIQLLVQYLNANKLLIDCLKYSLDTELKQKIEDEIFLAIAKIKET